MRRIALILAAALLAVSCSVVFMPSNVRKLEVGMTKHQVENIMGKSYSVVFSDGSQTVWGFVNPDPASTEKYILTFENDRLKTVETVIDPFQHYNGGAGTHRH